MLAQQLSVKVFARDPDSVEPSVFVAIFHKWIQEERIPDQLLIDVADYRHVPDGPSVLLVGHQAHYVIDNERGGAVGFLYNRKRDQPGELEDKLKEVLREALRAAVHLEEDPAKPVAFAGDRLRISCMSRRFMTNSDETFADAKPALDAVAKALYPEGHTLIREPDAKEPFTVTIEGASASCKQLLDRLG